MRLDPPLAVLASSALTAQGDAAATLAALQSDTLSAAVDAPARVEPAVGPVPPRRLRRLGRLSRLALAVCRDAMSRAGVLGREDAGIVVGTGLGALDETARFLAGVASEGAGSPTLFSGSVMNVAAGHVSLELGLRGYNTTVNHHETSGELALLVAARAVAAGRAPLVLACGVDADHSAALGDEPRPLAELAAALLLARVGSDTPPSTPRLLAVDAGRAATQRCAAVAPRVDVIVDDGAARAEEGDERSPSARWPDARRLSVGAAVPQLAAAGVLRAVLALEMCRGKPCFALAHAGTGASEVALLLATEAP